MHSIDLLACGGWGEIFTVHCCHFNFFGPFAVDWLRFFGAKLLVEWGVSMTHCRYIFALSQRGVVFI
jgi:hypothetical protein